jgi:RNA polymerase sigma-70 factor, ECF subfamily
MATDRDSVVSRNGERSTAAPSDDADRLAGLLARCAQRDAPALEELYRSVAPTLLGCLVKILRRRALAEEALQDVFVQVWQRADQYEAHRGRPYAWLVSMARYRAIDILRRERSSSADPQELAETLAGETEEADPTPSAADDRVLELCMARLEVEQRECIRLAFLDGRSHAQIATARSRPLGSVKSWIRRGLVMLKECIEACARPASN